MSDNVKNSNRKRKLKNLVVILLSVVLLLGVFSVDVFAGETTSIQTTTVSENESETLSSEDSILARPNENGALHVDGTKLVDENGETAELRGVSTHGLTWFPKFINEELFNEVSSQWGANLIRLANYSEEYSKGKEKESLKLVEKGIEYAVESDMYVIVDWHVLEEKNPLTNLSDAIDFFYKISKKYKDVSNVIYEICNEPNGDTTWTEIKEYASCVIPIIKSQNPDAVIIVGTPDYDRDLVVAQKDPIEGYSNIMYAFHFYAASHKEEMRNTLENAIADGLPIFVSECGLSEESGDGELDLKEAKLWFNLLSENQIPFTIWSLSNKDESSAMIKSSVYHKGYITDDELTISGKAVKTILNGGDLSKIAAEYENQETEIIDYLRDNPVLAFFGIAIIMAIIVIAFFLIGLKTKKKKKYKTYNDYIVDENKKGKIERLGGKIFLLISTVLTLTYLWWRVIFSVPVQYGALAIIFNIILLVVEIIGFIESSIHYNSMLQLRDYPLPEACEKDFPDVDVFVATYNEPEELLRKTIMGCKQMKYPDKKKVHIYICDDKRRPSMRKLAEELGVNYFDRPDNKGAKAGNLNHAMSLTSSPYIVTFDADMIPREDFLMQTIPYYIDAEKRDIPLGFIQTPQCFYSEDVFQHNLFAENNIPNEQDFFYRTIEVAKTSTNSVIYGGSNTILSRKALDDIGGFYTESITEDFATGMLIESKGYVSLGLPTPLASGLAPSSFEEHIQQRTRWGRGVIKTAKQLKFMSKKGLSIGQKLSYLSSVVYWFSSIFNLVYFISPLLYALFRIPVFNCTISELLLFWLPMFIAQNIALRLISKKSISSKWSALQEISVMPFLFLPIVQEMFGVSLSTFKVTDKSQKVIKRKRNLKALLPFIVLGILSILGICQVIWLVTVTHSLGLFILLFWLFRNLYFVLMSIFLVDGRDNDGENVKVKAAEAVCVSFENGESCEGITTLLTEHGVSLFLDKEEALKLGSSVDFKILLSNETINLKGTIVGVKKSRIENVPAVYNIEIMDFGGKKDEYIYALYNRIPTLPQSFNRDLGFLRYLFLNLVKHR